MKPPRSIRLMTMVAALAALIAFVIWWGQGPREAQVLRVPGRDRQPEGGGAGGQNPVLTGVLIAGTGKPAELPGLWPQFRGPNRDGLSAEPLDFASDWSNSPPKQLWSLPVGEGYAGAAVLGGRVYLMDYDRENQKDALRCLSLADGQEIWSFTYSVQIKRNHGMSRTTPSVTDKHVVAMGPKCHLVCLDSVSGQLRWGLDLVKDHGAEVPPWYAGQCPLILENVLYVAVGGPDALLLALNADTGEVLWKTPNPNDWKMTHSSIMPVEIAGEKTLIYCGHGGVVGVSQKTGEILWQTTDWKISIATVPSPVAVGDGKIFFSGGYNAGSLMLQVSKESAGWKAKTLFKLGPEIFGATQQSPILFQNHLFGIRPDGQFVCLTLDGKTAWTSGPAHQYGLGPFILAGDSFLVLNDGGLLSRIAAATDGFRLLGQTQLFEGHEAWGPLCRAGTRLIARDFNRLFCFEFSSGKVNGGR